MQGNFILPPVNFKAKHNIWTCKKIGKMKNETKIKIIFIITYFLQYYIHIDTLIPTIIFFLFSLQFLISNITKCVTVFFAWKSTQPVVLSSQNDGMSRAANMASYLETKNEFVWLKLYFFVTVIAYCREKRCDYCTL